MGYYVTLTESNFVIPADKLDDAYKAMCALNTTHHAEKRGGSWGAGVDPNDPKNRWFSWMDWNYPEVCKNAAEVLAQLGFECSDTNDGGLSIDWYDSKMGQEDLFLRAIAPFVEEGSYLVWRGEEGEYWRHIVQGGQLASQSGTVVFRES